MRKKTRPARNPLSGPDSGRTSGQQPPRSPAAHPRAGAYDMRLESSGTSSDTYEEAERVRFTVKDEDPHMYEEAERVRFKGKDEDLPPSLRGARRQPETKGPSSTSRSPAGRQQGGFNGRARHDEGGGASDNVQEDHKTSSYDDKYPADTNDGTNIIRILTSCKLAFCRSLRFIIIAIAVLALLGAGAGIIMYFTGTLVGPDEINMPSVVTDRDNWTTAMPVTSTVTATYLPVTLTNTAFLSATKLHRATNMFPPSNETATTPIPTAQTTSHDVVRAGKLPPVTTTLPTVTTTLPPATTTLPQVKTTMPQVTTTMPPVTTTMPQVTTAMPPVTATLPPVTATLPPVTTTLPPATTTLPPVTATLPPATTTLPPVTATLPPVTTTLPQVTTTLPQVTTTMPKMKTTMPQVTTTMPQVTTIMPQVKTTMPQVTTTMTQVSTTLAHVTPTLPPMATTLPHVTTILPQVTTTLPPVKTTLPPVTTTLPHDMKTTLQCLKLTPPAKGSMMTGSNSYRNEVYFGCDPGYKLVGRSRLTCQSDGTWSGTSPTCRAVRCPKLTAPANSTMIFSNGFYGKELRFRCDPGYTRVGHSLLTCQGDGTWTGKPPTCRAAHCLKPNPPIHGDMVGSCLYKRVMLFRCDHGYNLVGATTITCQADAVQCSKPTPPKNGHMVGSTLYKGKMRFICARGYNLVGARYITCQADGTWSGSVPTCKAVECKIGEPPVNGLMKKRRNRGINYLEFHCNQGYRLVGAKAIRCQTDGTWSDSVPTCKAMCRKGYRLLAKTCIGISLFRRKYSEAEAGCKSDGAKLAMPKTRELDLALRRLIRTVGKNSGYWIGLKRENSWQWADGSYLKNNDYKGWNPGEPERTFMVWISDSKCVQYWSKPTGIKFSATTVAFIRIIAYVTYQ
ncbi:hypothetical protein Bbelb_200040 [Branchiostoma belcheri]|nr:hypothetical protein Bbelb_200040 [Branchiostoma belcheri]